ncbi:phosphotransferase family protein [Sphingobium sp. DEHP117]|uniref:phosphotransferase family protein n=1 Tax=Sphingobium sp. DEHP117 TaxID=2993436 RepID=UPI0027D4D199|nr:phosphotransferase [Sphingobium sp. DEHP117]MDQ4420996.1 phosphotransferase family protein [Sphingobium sp. DEHP117]
MTAGDAVSEPNGRNNREFSVQDLNRWLADHAQGVAPITTVTKFAGGQSNPTYRVDTEGATAYVLRRKPFGELLPSAHAIEREYRLIDALHPTGFPVPRPLALCEDNKVIGAAFYLMEMVEGRTFWDGTLPEIACSDRRPLYEAMIDALAVLHSTDHVAIGLEDFAAPGNYFARQVGRWTKQYRAAQTDDIPEVERLIEWLPRSLPAQGRTSIIHGDYRIDNLIYASDSPRIAAVLDWELATIGDPLADFAYLAMNWIMPCDGRSGLLGVDCENGGLPTLDDAVARYCTVTDREGLPDLHWYFAYNLFRLVGIVQGIKRRVEAGNASSDRADAAVAGLMPLAKAAWSEARKAGATE